MSVMETIGGGLMMMGLVLGAMTGAIAMLLIPVLAGAAIAGIASWHKHRKNAISFRIPYPPYRY